MIFFKRHFMSHPRLNAVFSSDDSESIFAFIPEMINATADLFKAVDEEFRRDVFMLKVPSILSDFLKKESFTQPFLNYCRDVPLQKRIFSEAMGFSNFKKWIETLEKAAKEKGMSDNIVTYLMRPMLHLVRYHLVLNNVASRAHMAGGDTDVGAIHAAHHLAIKFSERANAAQAITERAETLLKLFKRLVSFN